MLSHCIIDTKTCALSGWVLLGLHFYLNKRYNTAIHVLEYTKSLTSLGQFPVSDLSHISIMIRILVESSYLKKVLGQE
jgi:hypothetical protein